MRFRCSSGPTHCRTWCGLTADRAEQHALHSRWRCLSAPACTCPTSSSQLSVGYAWLGHTASAAACAAGTWPSLPAAGSCSIGLLTRSCAAVWAVATIFAMACARLASFANSYGLIPALLAVPVVYLLAALAFSGEPTAATAAARERAACGKPPRLPAAAAAVHRGCLLPAAAALEGRIRQAVRAPAKQVRSVSTG